MEKSLRRSVLVNSPFAPMKGRAITRPTPCSPIRMDLAISHIS